MKHRWIQRLLADVSILVLLLTMAACGKTPPTSGDDAVDPQPTEEYTEPLVDGYNQITFYWRYNGAVTPAAPPGAVRPRTTSRIALR